MNIVGLELAREELQRPGYFFKAILNSSGIAFFSGNTQHREFKVPGLSYEDNNRGHALAAVVTAGRLEIRSHTAFAVDRVSVIVHALRQHPQLPWLRDFAVTYQGQRLP